MSVHVEFSASSEAKAVLASLGRTEDVKFSPSNRRLAVAGYHRNAIALFDIEIGASGGGKRVALTDVLEITSSSFDAPHGLAFIDDDTLVVANRSGGVPILRLPEAGTTGRKIDVVALQTISGDEHCKVITPGSVTVAPIDDNLCEVLVCGNYVDHVSRHILDKRENFSVRRNVVLLHKGLSTPDGVCVSQDGRWIAISNHDTHRVFLYENTPQLNRESEPDGILRNIHCPHGLRFTSDGGFMLVADAASPCVNVYAREGISWKGTHDPVTLFSVMSKDIFKRGRQNPLEGGPKGIDIDRDMNVLVTTCEQQILSFFDLPQVLAARGKLVNRHVRAFQQEFERKKFNLASKVRRRLRLQVHGA